MTQLILSACVYTEPEARSGKVTPLVDIDISKGYKEWVTLNFVHCGEVAFSETISVRQPVGRLRQLIAQRLCLYASIKQIQMFHKFCSPDFQDDEGESRQFEQLFLDSLPLSRFDVMDGDEIHFDISKQFADGALAYIYVRNYLPKFMSEIQ